MDFTHFNPQTQPEADFLQNFVARQNVFEFFLRQLGQLQPSQAAAHHLVIAPRGYGKTSLLRRIAIAIRTQPDLRSRLIPLSFREEQHNVISLDVFWRNCLQSLLEAREDENAPALEIAELDDEWERLAPRSGLKREEQDGEPMKLQFLHHCHRLKRRPVLLIDNLDSVLAGLPERHQWALRGELQASDGPVLIAAAPRYPEATHDPKAPFYDFFHIQILDKLEDEEVLRCLRVRAESRGERGAGVLKLMNQNPGRIAALNGLSGGNPRTLGVLYSVLESQGSSDVLQQLGSMLDTFTGWYQARTEELPMQSRAVFDALALNWDPMTAAQLTEATGLDTPAVSSHLARLEKSGFVENVSLSTSKKGRNGYQVTERFYNIWYLMRNGPRRARQTIRFLALFLQNCFDAGERHSLARKMLSENRSDPVYSLALAGTIKDERLKLQLIESAEAKSTLLGRVEEFGSVILEMKEEAANRNAGDLTSKSRSNQQAGKRSKKPQAPSDQIALLVAETGQAVELISRALELGREGKSTEAIEIYDKIIKRFGNSKESALQEQVAKALFNKGVRLGELGRIEEAIQVYDQVVQRCGDSNELALQEQVAGSLINKGISLWKLGKVEGAIQVYDQVVQRYGDSKESVLKGLAQGALVNAGNVQLDQLGNPSKAIELFKRALKLSEGSSESVFCHANCAYAFALHTSELAPALQHGTQALASETGLSASGRDLLTALTRLAEPAGMRWAHIFEDICTAVEREDELLWSDHIDDLQRWLWFIVVQGEGVAFQRFMESRQYPMKFAPLYHAFLAALNGEDHLLKINPETRQVAARLYSGLARRLKLYPKATPLR